MTWSTAVAVAAGLLRITDKNIYKAAPIIYINGK